MDDLCTLLIGDLMAQERVLIKLNVGSDRVDGVLAILPSMKSPTVSRHADDRGHAVETVVERTCVNTLIPN